jgi:predicted secreted protein
MKQLCCIVVLLVLASAGVFADMESELDLLGFSDDGAYVAFQLSGYNDGSAEAFSAIYIVDVADNDFATAPVTRSGPATTDGSAGKSFIDSVLSRARPDLERFGIRSGNTGLLAYEREGPHDWERLAELHEEAQFDVPDGRTTIPMTLLLDEREVQPTQRCRTSSEYPTPPRIFTLSIRERGRERVLQNDTVLYNSRNCPFGYEIYRVYVYGDSLAVFLSSLTPGFEGPDVYRLIVTGTLDGEYAETLPPLNDTAVTWAPAWASSLGALDRAGLPDLESVRLPSDERARATTFDLSAPVGTTVALRIYLGDMERVAFQGTIRSRITYGVVDVTSFEAGEYEYRVEAYVVLPGDSEGRYIEAEGTVVISHHMWTGQIVIRSDGTIVIVESFG